MRKSRVEAAATRERIVSNASKFLLTKGLASVGTRAVMAASGIAQGGFYRHFDSKEQVLAEAYQRAADHLLATLSEAIKGKSPQEALGTLVAMYLGQSQPIGEIVPCPLATLGSELKHAGDHLRNIAMLGHERFVDLIEGELLRLHKPEARMKATGMSNALIGALILASITPDRKIATQMLKDAQNYVLRDL